MMLRYILDCAASDKASILLISVRLVLLPPLLHQNMRHMPREPQFAQLVLLCCHHRISTIHY
jgi:hypothetical protein